MATSIDQPGSTCAGRLLPAACAVSLALVAGGVLLVQAQSHTNATCVDTALSSLSDRPPSAAQWLPQLTRTFERVQACRSANVLSLVGYATVTFGALVLLISSFLLLRRGARAAAAARPWPLHRATDTAARWIDARLPGRRGGAPRVRGGVLLMLLVVVVFAGVLYGIAALHKHQRAELLTSYRQAVATVAHRTFPAGIERSPESSCFQGDTACGYSTLNPPQLFDDLRQVVGGDGAVVSAGPGDCDLQRTPLCALTAVGHIDGFRVTAIAFWRGPILHRRPPRAAVPFTLGHSHLYYLGSTVHVSVNEPASLEK